MEAILEATSRDTFGKNEARRTRRSGLVPAVLSARRMARTRKPRRLPCIQGVAGFLHSESGANT